MVACIPRGRDHPANIVEKEFLAEALTILEVSQDSRPRPDAHDDQDGVTRLKPSSSYSGRECSTSTTSTKSVPQGLELFQWQRDQALVASLLLEKGRRLQLRAER
jgi:hypothetical protein